MMWMYLSILPKPFINLLNIFMCYHMYSTWLENGKSLINSNPRIKLKFEIIFWAFILGGNCHLSKYTCKWFWQAFWHVFWKLNLVLKQVWSLGFMCSTLWHFCSVFLFDVLKWNSILCQIYWIPDLQSLKLVCFVLANIWKQKYLDSWLFFVDKMAIFCVYLVFYNTLILSPSPTYINWI
mgnify:CR=1 FL=1